MLFRKKKLAPAPAPPPPPTSEPVAPTPDPKVVELLERLQKAGVQILVQLGGAEVYTSEVVGLGRDGFFIDTLSPPDGDRRMEAGRVTAYVETLFQGMTYTCRVEVLQKVQFIDELPAYKLTYPDAIRAERRRKSPRVDTAGDASLSFLKPFRLDAPVVNLSEGGLAFEYDADLGRLRRGTMLHDVLVELGRFPVLTVQGRIVGNFVAGLGGISLPRRYRASLMFQGLSDADRIVVESYLDQRKTLDATV